MVHKEKAGAIADFSSIKHEAAGMKVLTLLNCLLAETRVENDTASTEKVLVNQGKIELILLLIRYLMYEQPSSADKR